MAGDEDDSGENETAENDGDRKSTSGQGGSGDVVTGRLLQNMTVVELLHQKKII